jgi:hypothetical protein
VSGRRGRRRRRRRPGRPEGAAPEAPGSQQKSPAAEGAGPTKSRRSRRRRRGKRREPRGTGAPGTLEDVIRSIKGTPDSLSAEPDGQKLEDVIGDLQSVWGVPQYPQEYRLMIKVVEDGRAASPGNGAAKGPNGVTRERAPAAPRVGAGSTGEATGREKAPRRRRRSRKSRRKGSGGGAPG